MSGAPSRGGSRSGRLPCVAGEMDVLVSSMVLRVFVFVEGRRSGVTDLWAPLAANLAVGVSLGLPLFLYMRQTRLNGPGRGRWVTMPCESAIRRVARPPTLSIWRMAVFAAGIVLGAPASAPGQPQGVAREPSVTLPPDLARVLTDYEAAWRSRDAAALARLFAEDGFVLPNGHPPVRGRAAIRRYYTGSGGPLVLRALAFATDGAVGYIIGAFGRQDGEADVGKFTLTLRKGSDGRWLIASDMDSSNRRRE